MNKKISLILVLVFSLFSVMLIAVWGTLPENASNVEAENVVVSEYDEVNDDGDKFKNVTDIINDQNNIYVIEYIVLPENANVDIVASTASPGMSLQVLQDENKIYVIYDLESIAQKRTITIKITDKNSQNFDEITLWFKTPDVIIVPDI